MAPAVVAMHAVAASMALSMGRQKPTLPKRRMALTSWRCATLLWCVIVSNDCGATANRGDSPTERGSDGAAGGHGKSPPKGGELAPSTTRASGGNPPKGGNNTMPHGGCINRSTHSGFGKLTMGPATHDTPFRRRALVQANPPPIPRSPPTAFLQATTQSFWQLTVSSSLSPPPAWSAGQAFGPRPSSKSAAPAVPMA